MVRYFYAWIPIVIVVGTIVLLATPYLPLIALAAIALAVLAAVAWLAWLGVAALYGAGRWLLELGATPSVADAASERHQERLARDLRVPHA